MKQHFKKNIILVVGNYGYANHDLSGQTIKTRYTYELLKKFGTKYNIQYFDTQTLHKRRNIFKLLWKICNCDTLLYLPAHDNLKYLFPLYFILSKICRFEIVYSVIGGWLVPYLRNLPVHRCLLKRIRIILAETTKMKNDLESEYNFKNIDVLYNFRITDFRPKIRNNDYFKLVFMARIDPQKGLDTILNFCKYARELDLNLKIDFYGQIDISIINTFESTLKEYPFARYCGVLEPEDIFKTICQYDLLLLPTHYYTEGLPGSLIEANLSGVPAIVSEWMHSREFVDDGISGFIIPFENHQEEFNNSIMSVYNDMELLNRLKKGAIEKSKLFTSNFAWEKISQYL